MYKRERHDVYAYLRRLYRLADDYLYCFWGSVPIHCSMVHMVKATAIETDYLSKRETFRASTSRHGERYANHDYGKEATTRILKSGLQQCADTIRRTKRAWPVLSFSGFIHVESSFLRNRRYLFLDASFSRRICIL